MAAIEELRSFQKLAKNGGAPCACHLLIKRAQAAAAAEHASPPPPPPRKIHPHYHRLVHDHRLLHYGLSDCRFSPAVTHDFILMACLTYPDCIPERLPAIAKFIMWIFFFDDFFDDPRLLGAEPEAATDLAETVLAFLRKLSKTDSASGEVKSSMISAASISSSTGNYKDVLHTAVSWWEEFRQLGMTATQQFRFLDIFEAYLKAILRQTQYRKSGSVAPNLPSYSAMRAEGSGTRVCSGLLEFCLGLDVLSYLRPDEKVTQLLNALDFNAALEVAFFNDLRSLPKELEISDFMSLVPYLYVLERRQRKYGRDGKQEEAAVEAAVKGAWRMVWQCGAEARRLEEEIEAELEEEGEVFEGKPMEAEKIRRYVRGLADLVAGLNEWQLEATRYAS